MDDLLAEVLQLLRHACSEGKLDVLGKFLGNLAFALDVICDVLASERDGSIVSHDIAMVD